MSRNLVGFVICFVSAFCNIATGIIITDLGFVEVDMWPLGEFSVFCGFCTGAFAIVLLGHWLLSPRPRTPPRDKPFDQQTGC